eukprot:351937-Chlamydomonas_euryale.AAC.20
MQHFFDSVSPYTDPPIHAQGLLALPPPLSFAAFPLLLTARPPPLGAVLPVTVVLEKVTCSGEVLSGLVVSAPPPLPSCKQCSVVWGSGADKICCVSSTVEWLDERIGGCFGGAVKARWMIELAAKQPGSKCAVRHSTAAGACARAPPPPHTHHHTHIPRSTPLQAAAVPLLLPLPPPMHARRIGLAALRSPMPKQWAGNPQASNAETLDWQPSSFQRPNMHAHPHHLRHTPATHRDRVVDKEAAGDVDSGAPLGGVEPQLPQRLEVGAAAASKHAVDALRHVAFRRQAVQQRASAWFQLHVHAAATGRATLADGRVEQQQRRARGARVGRRGGRAERWQQAAEHRVAAADAARRGRQRQRRDKAAAGARCSAAR